LSGEAVEIGRGGFRNAKVFLADVVNGFVVKQEGNIGVLEEGMSREDAVVRLHDRGGDLRRWVDAEIELGLLWVVVGQVLQEQ